jgi:hypothetical protein
VREFLTRGELGRQANASAAPQTSTRVAG